MADEMGKNVLWRDTNDVEFDHALEGLEKFVMNKLHDRYARPRSSLPPNPTPPDCTRP